MALSLAFATSMFIHGGVDWIARFTGGADQTVSGHEFTRAVRHNASSRGLRSVAICTISA
jgi:hypothetical protein